MVGVGRRSVFFFFFFLRGPFPGIDETGGDGSRVVTRVTDKPLIYLPQSSLLPLSYTVSGPDGGFYLLRIETLEGGEACSQRFSLGESSLFPVLFSSRGRSVSVVDSRGRRGTERRKRKREGQYPF